MALLLALRLVHVASGALWVGFVVFTAFYLIPSIQEAGPDGGRVMAALQRRGIMSVTPVLAVATLASGLWLYWRQSGGFDPGYMGSGPGITFGLGATLALAGFIVGMTIMRPSLLRAAAVMREAAVSPESERGARMAEAGRLRARGAGAARLVAVLVVLATGAMAVARYA